MVILIDMVSQILEMSLLVTHKKLFDLKHLFLHLSVLFIQRLRMRHPKCVHLIGLRFHQDIIFQLIQTRYKGLECNGALLQKIRKVQISIFIFEALLLILLFFLETIIYEMMQIKSGVYFQIQQLWNRPLQLNEQPVLVQNISKGYGSECFLRNNGATLKHNVVLQLRDGLYCV